MARYSTDIALSFFKIWHNSTIAPCAGTRGVLNCSMIKTPCPSCGNEKTRHRPGKGWECRPCNRGHREYRVPGNNRIPQPIRRALYAAKGDACPACAAPWSDGTDARAPNRVTVDRLVPGGPYNDAANLRILCGRCNASKGDMTAAELRRLADWVDREMGDTT